MIKNAIYVCRSTVKLWNTMFYPGNEVLFIESGIDEFGSETVTIKTDEENKIVCSKFLFSNNFILITKPKG